MADVRGRVRESTGYKPASESGECREGLAVKDWGQVYPRCVDFNTPLAHSRGPFSFPSLPPRWGEISSMRETRIQDPPAALFPCYLSTNKEFHGEGGWVSGIPSPPLSLDRKFG